MIVLYETTIVKGGENAAVIKEQFSLSGEILFVGVLCHSLEHSLGWELRINGCACPPHLFDITDLESFGVRTPKACGIQFLRRSEISLVAVNGNVEPVKIESVVLLRLDKIKKEKNR